MDTPGRLPRPVVRPLASAAAFALIVTAGLALPAREQGRRDDLVARITADATHLAGALEAYRRDVGAWPAPVFDLSSGYRGGLVERDFADAAHRPLWAGPYLQGLGRPTTNGFWSLPATRPIDAPDDSKWLRVHRGFGEVDDDVATAVDALVDDGAPDRGAVRVTPSWIWFDVGSVSG